MKVKSAENTEDIDLEEDVSLEDEDDISIKDDVSLKEEFSIENTNEDDFIEEEPVETTEELVDKFSTSYEVSTKLPVKSKFPKNATSVECIITATGYKDRVIAPGKELRLLQARLYLIPVDTDVNSDDYNYIKVMSDMSDSIDVRYIKDGFACVSALKHNVKIKDNVRLAILS